MFQVVKFLWSNIGKPGPLWASAGDWIFKKIQPTLLVQKLTRGIDLLVPTTSLQPLERPLQWPLWLPLRSIRISPKTLCIDSVMRAQRLNSHNFVIIVRVPVVSGRYFVRRNLGGLSAHAPSNEMRRNHCWQHWWASSLMAADSIVDIYNCSTLLCKIQDLTILGNGD